MRRQTRLLLIALLCIPVLGWGETSQVGILVMAHGGTSRWNDTVKQTVKEAEIPYPTRIFFGMGMNKDEVDDLQEDVNYLQGKGAQTIVVIPLLISSYSEVYRQWRYLLGIDIKPGFIDNPLFPIEKQATIQFMDPLNDDPVVGMVLLDHAREISQTPDQETVLLVAHGPNDDGDNAEWLATLKHLSDIIQQHGKFKDVIGMTLRDDAPTAVRAQAVDALRAQVDSVDKEGGRVLVIPLLIAPGGIENKIGVALKGMDYTLNAKVLLPDRRISQWIRSRVP